MKIDDATAVYFGDLEASRVYLGSNAVWAKTSNLFLKSNGYTGTQGFSVGTPVIKNMDSATKTTAGAYLPGIEQLRSQRSYWQNWGDDIFNGWGFFYIYNPATDKYLSPVFQQINQADGVIATETFTLDGRTFTIKHGYAAQGIYKFDVSVNDSNDFVFGMDGNLGSNGATSNSNLSHNYTKLNEGFTLHYNYNVQTTVPTEDFFTYFVPYEQSKNKSTRPYLRYIYSSDNLALHTVALKHGTTVYVSKQNDVRDWVVNDIQLTTL